MTITKIIPVSDEYSIQVGTEGTTVTFQYRVMDGDGDPVASAPAALWIGGSGTGNVEYPFVNGMTDENGMATFDSFWYGNDGKSYILWAVCAGQESSRMVAHVFTTVLCQEDEVHSYTCPDGSIIHDLRCLNNAWVPTDETCKTPQGIPWIWLVLGAAMVVGLVLYVKE